MKCKHCEDKLLEYLYGELSEEEAATMEKHLEASEECRQAYEGFASVLETVAKADEEGPVAALHTRIMGHAEEARPARRSFWAWMLRPAVTTAVIGAVAAGVYFTSLRHKPPSLLDERVLSEESPVRKSKQRSTPPSSVAKVDALKKEAKEKGFLARLAEPPAAIEQEEAAPEPLGAPEHARPPQKKSQVAAVGSMDEELASAQVRERVEAFPAEEDRAVAGGVVRAPSPNDKTSAVPKALSASPGRDVAAAKAPMHQTISQTRDLADKDAPVPEAIGEAQDLADEDAPLPDAIARARDLASEGKCVEAEEMVETYSTDRPKEEASGVGWLEVARCFAKEGDTKAAREMAEKALAIPAHEPEARAFLASLPP